MAVLLVVPARFASSRFPGKPLAMLRGAGGEARSLVRRSWEAARAVAGVGRVVVATEDARIRDHAEGFGAEVVMTSDRPRNGTERCAEVLDALGGDWEAVVNLQGDAPLTPPWFVEALVAALAADRTGAAMATPVLRMEEGQLAAFRGDRAAGRVGGTTAVFGQGGRALYFSKEVLPFGAGAAVPAWHHVGAYAYRPGALAAYRRWPPGALEEAEGLEQLRFLEAGAGVLEAMLAALGIG